MQEVEFFEFAFGKGVVFAISYAVVLFRFLKILLHAPAVLVELADTLICVGKMAGFVQLKCPLQVFGIAEGAFAEDIGKIALSEIISQ